MVSDSTLLSRFHQRRFALHGDGLLRGADLQRHFDIGGAAGLHLTLSLDHCALKAGLGDRQLVSAKVTKGRQTSRSPASPLSG